ncbi:Crp/Fnr family transcriptional regulator [Herbidospora sp. NBRC 101105]|uniref:Crp/Fnr family transcriptional regulator n=1 Tax=Herbidospora sp. NBRC 101105 TaxID=3032195 RepID=UPI0024A09009|nr:Crp/Fnr family transcriptional regulator [Herbidospora sp. NBRC 101105]GLX95212.1 Crp/Fnr family transcriptional regulator [Herbidospora sp. NBRC 101105]
MDRLSPDDQKALLALAPATPRMAGDPIIYQGDRETSDVFLLRSMPGQRHTACVKVTAYLESGGSAMLGIRVAGDVVGELAGLRRQPRVAMVTACSPMMVHAIRSQAFTDFLDRSPAAWNAVARMIADRLDWANRRRTDFAQFSVPVRVAQVLVELSGRHGVDTADGKRDIGIDLTHEEIANLVGARKDAVFKAVRRFKDLALITNHGRKIVINPIGLADFR